MNARFISFIAIFASAGVVGLSGCSGCSKSKKEQEAQIQQAKTCLFTDPNCPLRSVPVYNQVRQYASANCQVPGCEAKVDALMANPSLVPPPTAKPTTIASTQIQAQAVQVQKRIQSVSDDPNSNYKQYPPPAQLPASAEERRPSSIQPSSLPSDSADVAPPSAGGGSSPSGEAMRDRF